MLCVGLRLCGDTEEAPDELHLPYCVSAVHRFTCPFLITWWWAWT